MTREFYRKGYDPDAEHLEVPTLPWSKDTFREEVERYARTPVYGERLPSAEDIERVARYYEEHYPEDAPLKEFVGVVWRRDNPESSYLNPDRMVRIWARGSRTASLAVTKHLGDGYAKSIWNWEEAWRRR